MSSFTARRASRCFAPARANSTASLPARAGRTRAWSRGRCTARRLPLGAPGSRGVLCCGFITSPPLLLHVQPRAETFPRAFKANTEGRQICLFEEERALTKHTVRASSDNSNAALLRKLATKREGLIGRSGENRSSQKRSVS